MRPYRADSQYRVSYGNKACRTTIELGFSETPRELPLDSVVLDGARDLAEVGHAKGRLRRDEQVEPSLYQRAVSCLWHAGDTKAHAGALERQRRVGRHVIGAAPATDLLAVASCI